MVTPHQKHLNRVQEAMRGWGADLMFLNFGPDLTYVTGLLTPRYYDSLKGKGDWINGLLFGVDQDPILLLQRSMAMDNIAAKTWVKDIRVLPDGADPDAFLGQALAEFRARGQIHRRHQEAVESHPALLAGTGARRALRARHRRDDGSGARHQG